MTPSLPSPEARAREKIDQLLRDAGWIIQHRKETNLSAGRGIAICEFPMKSGFGEADYLLYVDGQALGVVEAKKEGSTLTGFEGQTTKYSEGLPDSLPAPKRLNGLLFLQRPVKAPAADRHHLTHTLDTQATLQ